MALPGRKPRIDTTQERLKLLLFGEPNSRKSDLCSRMAGAFFIDTEDGADKPYYQSNMIANNSTYYGVDEGASDPDAVLKVVKELAKTKHEFITTVIDSFTTLFEAKTEAAARKVGTDYGKHMEVANRWAKELFRELTLLDTNVVVTSHAKDVWSSGDKAGQTADGFKKQMYLFDLVLQLERMPSGKAFAVVKKTRYAEFPDGDRFEFSYEELEKRWGKERLGRAAVPVTLATAGQVESLNRKTAALNIPQDEIAKWLDKAGVDSFKEFTKEQIDKCLAYCQKKLDEAQTQTIAVASTASVAEIAAIDANQGEQS